MDRHKRYRAKMKLKKIEHEQNNGLELGYPGVRISDFIKEKILSHRTQILVVNGVVIQFHKDCVTGYWVNNTYKLRLHREKLRIELGLTKEQMKNYDVHHIDGDKDNNDISNLECIPIKQHVRHHFKKDSDGFRRFQEAGWIAAKEWHRSTEGREWHRKHGKEVAAKQKDIIKVCKECGKEFVTKRNFTEFCSDACGERWRGKHRRIPFKRVCVVCGKEFEGTKYKPSSKEPLTCSKTCANKLNHQHRKEKSL